jgi:hypothetical protein
MLSVGRRPAAPPTGRPRLAAITMVRNEAAMLPRWIRHYSEQCSGPESLVVIDDNTTDGSTDGLPCSVIRTPSFIHRQFEPARLGMVSHIASGLLEAYDAVVFADADEFLVADPDRYGSLRDLVAAKPDNRVFGAMGLNVVHHVGHEPPLDPERPILAQRRMAKFIPLMCKPAIKKVHGQWTAASHGLRHTEWTIDPDLYMFHAKFADRDTLREAAEHRRAGVELEGRPGTTSWKFGGDTMVSLLDKVTKGADPDLLAPFEPTPELLDGIVRAEDDTFRARGGRQVPAMKKADLVLIPERFHKIV